MIAIIAIVVVVAVAALAGSWYFLSKQTGDTNPITALQKKAAGQALNPNCDYHDPDLCRFLNNMKSQPNYTATITSKDSSGKTYNSSMQISGNNSHMSYAMDNMTMETTALDNAYYVKQSDGTWLKYSTKQDDSNMMPSAKFDIPSATASADVRVTFKKIGKVSCDNLTCFKYSSTDPSTDGTTYIYFDDTQYLLRRMEITTKDGTFTMTYNYAKVAIPLPSPVKDAPTVSTPTTITPSTVIPTLTQEQMDQLKQLQNQVQMNSSDVVGQ